MNRNRLLGLIALIAVMGLFFAGCDDNNAVSIRTFTVTFDAVGGNPTPATQTVNEGSFATVPSPAPTRDGYGFVHWVLQGQTTAFDFDTPITANITLAAVWSAVTFTVTFNADGGSPTPAMQTVGEGGRETLPTPEPTRDGYDFVHWSLQGQTTEFDFNTPITENITLTAQWIELFTVTFNADGGNPTPEPQTVRQGNTAALPTPAPTRDGYDFVHWSPQDQTTEFNFSTPITANITLTAQWTRMIFTPGQTGQTGYFTWQFLNNEMTITGYTGTETDITIPSQIYLIPVTTIGQQAFQNHQLTSVNIPDSVTSIGWRAFENNQLTSVTIPNSVTSIWDSAFDNNQLTSVTIGNSVTSIGQIAFRYNQLISVTIPDSVTFIGHGAFQGNQLTSVTIGNSVTTIEGWAFAGNWDGSSNRLNSVTIPDSVTFIAEAAFANNQLTSVTFIGNSVTFIGSNAFRNNQPMSTS